MRFVCLLVLLAMLITLLPVNVGVAHAEEAPPWKWASGRVSATQSHTHGLTSHVVVYDGGTGARYTCNSTYHTYLAVKEYRVTNNSCLGRYGVR